MTTRESLPVARFLAVIRRRQQVVDALWGAAAGGAVAAGVLLVAHAMRSVPPFLVGTSATLLPIGAAVNLARRRRDTGGAALAAERRFPELQNLLRTAWELTTGTTTATGSMHGLVLAQTDSRIASLDARSATPLSHAVWWAVAALAMWLVLAGLSSAEGSAVRDRVVTTIGRRTGVVSTRVEARVQFPSYSGMASVALVDPERITALQGSRVSITLSTPDSAQFIHDADTTALERDGQNRRASMVVARDGFVVLRTFDGNGREQFRRLIGISATADLPPLARITTPGRDLFLTDATRNVDIVLEANDDLGLRSLKLRFTKVSGSGERFTFSDGDVPIALTRTNSRSWTARGRLPLGTLALERGDMVVYRAIAADGRPGAAPVESDAFIVEVIGIGGDAAEGFSIDPDQDRYAVSQQMVVLKTERLLARRSGMDSSTLADASRELAMEQRRVRAEFVFMMGGELAEEITAENSMDDLDETHEAEGESDLSAGRMANQGRAALLAAIRAMSRASTALNVAQLDRALVHERTAVRELERAFSRTRYLLRAFTEREVLDLSRRMTGSLEDAQSSRRPIAVAPFDEQKVKLQAVLRRLERGADSATSTTLAGAAEAVLSIDASSGTLQRIAGQLSRASRFNGASMARQATIDSVTLALGVILRGDSHAFQTRDAHTGLGQRLLGGALRDAVTQPPRR